jgi:hypothetical protein
MKQIAIRHLPVIAAAAFLVAASPVGESQAAGTTPAPVVVDANGKVVGKLIGPGTVMRVLGTVTVWFTVNQHGFTSQTFRTLYTTTDCTGTKYMGAVGLPNHAYTQFGNSSTYSGWAAVYYPAPTTAVLDIKSYRDSAKEPCTTLPGVASTEVGAVTRTALSFTPPFSIK